MIKLYWGDGKYEGYMYRTGLEFRKLNSHLPECKVNRSLSKLKVKK